MRADRLELLESSGPLPPKYQYSLEIRLDRRELTWSSEGAANPLASNPSGVRSREGDSPLLELLDAPPPPAGRVGASYNSLTFWCGEEAHRVEYLLNSLDDDSHKELHERIEALKALTR